MIKVVDQIIYNKAFTAFVQMNSINRKIIFSNSNIIVECKSFPSAFINTELYLMSASKPC